MESSDYRKALDAARAEIQEILAQRTQLDERLNQLKKIVDALSALLEEVPSTESFVEVLGVGITQLDRRDVGISDAIRQILSYSQVPLSPTGVRNELTKRGFILAEYANPLAVIHNTLKRLLAQDEIVGVRDASQQIVAYARRTVPPPPGSDSISGSHPADKLRAPKPPIPPEEAKRLAQQLAQIGNITKK
jgi:hypothetical protein